MPHHNTDHLVLRSTFNRVLAVVVWALCGVFAASALLLGLESLVRAAPILAAIAYLVWVALWQPSLVVDDDAATLHNPFRTVRVPWAALVHIDTKFAMTLVTPTGRYPAWVAPAPGALTARRLSRRARKREELDPLEAGRDAGTLPGDLRGSESATAADLVRTRWEARLAAGAVPIGQAHAMPAQVTWHTGQMAVLAALVALSIVAALV